MCVYIHTYTYYIYIYQHVPPNIWVAVFFNFGLCHPEAAPAPQGLEDVGVAEIPRSESKDPAPVVSEGGRGIA